MYMQQSSSSIETQIKILETSLSQTPEKIEVKGVMKFNPRYFALKGKIKNLGIALVKAKSFEFLAR